MKKKHTLFQTDLACELLFEFGGFMGSGMG